MFLHIGTDYSVPVKDITLILDCEIELPESTRTALNMVKYIDTGDTRRSAVLTPGLVYYSAIAKGTLRKRLKAVTSCKLQVTSS